jgi:hypothetical protein
MKTEICEKCQEEKSPFDLMVSEFGINVNGETFDVTPMIVCGGCEEKFQEEEMEWDEYYANDWVRYWK